MPTKYGGPHPTLPAQDVKEYRETFVERLKAWWDERKRKESDRKLEEIEDKCRSKTS